MTISHEETGKAIIRIKAPIAGELRENGTTANIQIGDGATFDSLLAFGFRKIKEDRWVYIRDLGCDICFTVTMRVSDLNDLKIDVIDDDFGQPYDYQLYIMNSEKPGRVVSIIYEKVEAELKKLQDAGIIQGHVRGNYV